jgi:hypothetical protein
MPLRMPSVSQSVMLGLLKDIHFQIKRWLQNSKSYLPSLQ